ncbi:hypothetical protein ACFZAR_44490, partial [Streptomyces sp. NPDC008222]|uniref:hypothetical protein n=1 Tax=Streptomyces sp. NPDC008222 TaxID=3364820 RepID=UPI0036E0182B
GTMLPFETAGTFHYNKRVGYDLTVCDHAPGTPAVPLAELERTLLKGGVLLADVRALADAGEVPDNLVETRDLVLGGVEYKVFLKKG